MNGDKRTGPIVAKEEASKLSEKRDFIAGIFPVIRKDEKGETARNGRGFRTRRLEREDAPSTGPKGGCKSLRVISSRRVSVPNDVTSTATAMKENPTAPFGAGAGTMPTLPEKPRCGRRFCPRRERGHLGGARDGSIVPQGFRPE